MKYYYLFSILLLLVFLETGNSQDLIEDGLPFEVMKVYPPFAISELELFEANTLSDLNTRYPSSWVKEYISVQIITSHNGELRKSVGKNDTLNPLQKNRIKQADVGANITVLVQYLPDNNLTHNDIKEIDFTLYIDPAHKATLAGDQQDLDQYLMENAIRKIPDGLFKEYQLAAVKFKICEVGQVKDAHIFWSSEDEEIDTILLETVCNMPPWKPAQYSNGQKVQQEFAFIVGSMESCVIPLLNVRRE